MIQEAAHREESHYTQREPVSTHHPPHQASLWFDVLLEEPPGTGQNSRFIPFSFNYDEPLKADILRFINSDETLRKENIKIRKRRMQNITIPEDIKPLLANDARRIAFSIEEFCRTPLVDRIFGARALHHISSYIKAIALRNDEKTVTGEHYESFKHLLNYFNFDCSLLLSEKPVASPLGV